MNIMSWSDYLKRKTSSIKNENIESTLGKGASLLTPDFKKDNVTGVRMDQDYKNDPKEYEKVQKFLKGTNAPEKQKPNGWFVMDESNGQFWLETDWGNILSEEDLAKALLSTERSAEILSGYVGGKIINVTEDVLAKIREQF